MTDSAIDIEATLDDMTQRLRALLTASGRDDVALIGIHSGGVWIAQALHERLGTTTPLGEINITFYRDDFSRIGMHPRVKPSNLPFPVEDRHIVLVDDVLYTGRTIRAALNEIFDYGRPASVTLAVLVERGGRELPIQADIIGQTITPAQGEHVKLLGPEPLVLVTKGTGQ
ncbi:pyrimidine operon attenuation protein/uracil phosphoribosyltransferase [Methylohalomonas lacus]|uniref:Bifunctional protein PyrR n=1 Tax=Methylohalomonas lacus TaxID=398773 RepID=A0AAE3HLC0_9GAMM|nr:bifunctional pyr operon transcriptional regulator/uracil phosphoribosyltransferase PyrR [Methylohalomonas lacus]MCS3903239.1 pyrimidine operon attenuation protein/uracil phosphoribosyltransferase [Methylohalomonas lacus]